MRVHHLNCGTMCPYSERVLAGVGSALAPATLVCHCLLIESPAGLVLVDTGFGLADIAHARERLGAALVAVGRLRLDPRERAVRQVQAPAYSPPDAPPLLVPHLD